MTRYIENLNECTDPVSGDYLWVADASAGSTDKDRKVNINKFAMLSSGTWTPAVSGSGSAPSVTYSATRYGYYMRVGDLVFASFVVETTAFSGGSGNLVITMPFTAANLTGGSATTVVSAKLDYAASKTFMVGTIDPNTNVMYFLEQQDNTAPTVMPITAWGATSYVQGSIVYRV